VIILTTVDGLYSSNPEKPESKLIPVVEKITPEIRNATEGKSQLGRGGMKTTLEAAEIAMRSGIPLMIANSRRPNVLFDILDGKNVGTLFMPNSKGLPGIKRWIGYGAGAKGQIHVNEGARNAILKGASLLAVGIEAVSGQFQVGDVVSLVGPEGDEFGRGTANYTSDEINQAKGMNISSVKKTLGYVRQKEIVTRKRMHLNEKEA
jgi:glutamate 5-kinase